MGFGLIEFKRGEKTVETVQVAQNATLDVHVFKLQVSKRRSGDRAEDVR